MSSLTRINNNSSVVNVGRTTPVSPGVQPSSRSIPVVVASDQEAIPVVEQNKIQSEVSLSLLGIPRAEVALGIFADVNTYDVNPTEWSYSPPVWQIGYGTRHLPAEAGALVEAPRDKTAVLTSKRFFRYQPGRVSAATFGIKSSISQASFSQNPIIRKYGIYDNFDGYYWETRQDGKGDNFSVVRRSQSLLKHPTSIFGLEGQFIRSSVVGANIPTRLTQTDDYRIVGTPPVAGAGGYSTSNYIRQRNVIKDNRLAVAIESLTSNTQAKCQRDIKYFIDGLIYDLTLDTNYNATFQGLAETNSDEYPDIATDYTTDPANPWNNVAAAITSTRAEVLNTGEYLIEIDNSINSYFDRIENIAINQGSRVDYTDASTAAAVLLEVTFNGDEIGGTRQDATNTITSNRVTWANSVNSFVAGLGSTAAHEVDRCTRDVYFTLNAIAYDILYGGNSATWQAARFFMYDGTSQSDKSGNGYITQTASAYNELKSIVSSALAASQPTEAAKASALIELIRQVILTTSISHLPPKEYPTVIIGTAKEALTEAKNTILANKNRIAVEVSPITLTDDDEKCLRDVDFWIDMYLYDLEAGGDAHTAYNTYNYRSALLPDKLREVEMHFNAKTKLLELFTGDTVDEQFFGRLQELTEITVDFFESNSPQTNPVIPTGFGTKSQFETVFDARKYYWAYYAATFDPADPETFSPDTHDYTNPPPTHTYTTYTKNGREFSVDEVKDKCIRDMVYVIEGYRDDVLGGGNFATKFNASMYYQGSGLSIGSQAENGVLAEISKHTLLKKFITDNISDFSQRNRTTTLADLIIANFTYEDTGNAEPGNRGVAGNLVVLRDGLVMVHAAVYDPSLLKEQERIPAAVFASNNTIRLANGHVTFGQRIRYFGPEDGGLENGKIYKVRSVIGTKGSAFTLLNEQDVDGGELDITSNTQEAFVQIVNPFIFPDVYNPEVYRTDPLYSVNFGANDAQDPFVRTNDNQRFDYRGMMFPYKYTSDGILPKTDTSYSVGYIDTANPAQTEIGLNQLRTEIDDVNFTPEYINFVRDNVKPEYWGVYEYRVPRSRFSTDKLNGKTNNVVYSDLAIGQTGKVLPGQPVIDVDGTVLENTSLYDFDFTKVTMLKIEFSWYGAVGALFLAYVPVDNGEARWVRVHHLRASNQLKISSLGNATLPITYTVYGGGSSLALGDGEDLEANNYGYSRDSHNLVKYGASYYIDGGDRGTVRLYSHTNSNLVEAYGTNHTLGPVTINGPDDAISLPYIDLGASLPHQVEDARFYMGSQILTENRIDQNIRVQWVDGSKIYLSGTPANNSVVLVPDRNNTVYGIETKENIKSSLGLSVRNRVQVYPTKMSALNTSGTLSKSSRLRMRKTPVFQNDTPTSGTFTVESNLALTGEVSPLTPTFSSINYLENGQSVFGWFRVEVDTVKSTAFGRLYRESAEYYFELREAFNGIVTVLAGGSFLKDLRFDSRGIILSGETRTVEEKEGLSSVVISESAQVPIPRTGEDIATIYMKENGTEQIELNTYYDYNKEYLSFPLTDIAESLYMVVDISEEADQNVNVGIGVTWEEQ